MRRYAALWLLLWVACATNPEAGHGSPCALLPAHEIAQAPTLLFDAVAVAQNQAAPWVVWSHAEGLFVRPVNAEGAPLGETKRLGERCRGGVALTFAGGRAWVLCSRPADTGSDSAVALMQLGSDASVVAERTLGPVGRDGSGVALASTPTRLIAAYHDGTVGAYAARLSSVPLDAELTSTEPQHILLSDLTYAAGPPSVATRGEHWLTAFSETRYGLDGARTRLMLRSDSQSARTLRESLIVDPVPALGWDEESAWIAYRDRNLKNPKPELYAARLTNTLKLAGKPNQIGRANSDGPPQLFECGREIIALLPREYASERYIAVHALDERLSNLGAGHQYYANSRDFVLSHGACIAGKALTVASERKAPAEPGAALMAMGFQCNR